MENIQEEEQLKGSYILHFILASSMNAEETDKHRAEVNEKIQAAGGEIQASLCQDSARGLAYPIRKESNGYFCESVFTLARTNVKELSDTLKHDSSIIRYMIEHREKKRPPEKARRTRKMPRPSIVAPSDSAPAPLQEKRTSISMDEIDKKLDEIIKNI